MRKHKEGDTVTAILQFLLAHRIPAWRMNTGATKIGGRFLRFGVVGMADIIGILPVLHIAELNVKMEAVNLWGTNPFGQFLAIEVKSEKGKLTPAQQGFLAQVNAAGGKAFVARSVEEVAMRLAGCGPVPPLPTFGGRTISWATARRMSEDGP